MAGRIRTIKPEVLGDAKAARLSDRAWRLWVSMWTLADDVGLLPADADYLAAQVFWGTSDRSAVAPLAELERTGMVRLYRANGDQYAQIAGWAKHQKIDRPNGNRFPLPPAEIPNPRESSREIANDREGSCMDHDQDHDLSFATSATPPVAPVLVLIPDPKPAFDIEDLYEAYPRKKGKTKGLARLKKIITTQALYDVFLGAIANYRREIVATKTKPEFVKYFSSFVSEWEDYARVPTTVTSCTPAELTGDAKLAYDQAEEHRQRRLRGEGGPTYGLEGLFEVKP